MEKEEKTSIERIPERAKLDFILEPVSVSEGSAELETRILIDVNCCYILSKSLTEIVEALT